MDFPDYETLKTGMAEPHVLLVTLNRPEVANALNTQMGRDFLDLWTRLTEDAEDVRCVILTGAGEKVFCAGGDLKERNGMTRQQWQRQHELFERQYWTLSIFRCRSSQRSTAMPTPAASRRRFPATSPTP